MSEKLINPDVPDRRINVRQALKEIMDLLDQFPELRNIIRLKISKVYNP